MGKRKSPFSEVVYKEWELLAFPKDALDQKEKKRRWAALYRQTRKADAWTVGSPDADLVASMGSYLAIEEKRWAYAAQLCTEFLAHPDAQADGGIHDSQVVMLGCMTILLGDATAGAKTLLDPLCQEKRSHFYRAVLRSRLLATLDELGDVDPPDPAVTNLVSITVGQYRGRKRASKAAFGAKSHKELFDLLLSAIPARRQSTELP